jgi:NAD(P)-dependent dehydrogenase (short-subunit alcohol dehydrogenase family)
MMANSGGATWLITGCSSGLGRALAEIILARGERVAATARHPQSLSDLAAAYPETSLTLPLDIRNYAQLKTAVEQTEQALGPIDVLVNNAGAVRLGAIEETTDEDYRAMFDTNFFGPIQAIREVLPGMRKRRRGCIVNVTSVGSFSPPPGASAYSAAKAALDIASEALSAEVAPFGIKVIVVVLGAFRTRVMESLTYADKVIVDYKTTAHATRDRFASISGHQAGDTHKGALAIFDVVQQENPPLRLLLGRDTVERVRAKLIDVGRQVELGAQTADYVTYG